MKPPPDITYASHGLFAAFYPETEAGRLAWGELVAATGCHRVLTIQAGEIIARLEAAGYTVGKDEGDDAGDDELIAQLAE
jgi:hypothetical protein